ncbi:MAG: winged helix-turn-helix domain-containing protein [Thermoprotei archaeon]
MKRLAYLDGKALRLVQDPLNQKILGLLVRGAHNVSWLSKNLNESPLKVWRRVRQLESEGLVEERGVLRERNLEAKLYRATAARYIPRGVLDYVPEDEWLKQAYTLYREIQTKILRVLLTYDRIPESVNPIDFCVATDIYAYTSVLTEQETQQKLRTMLSLLEKSNMRSVVLRGKTV